jgi:hypothetical protein
MLKPSVAAALICAATVARAEPPRLSGQEISDLVAGATVEIDTPLGTKLPVRYGRDGQLSGQARELAPYLGAATDTGRWWVASDQLCHKWKHWLNAEPQCFRLRKHGRTLHWWNQDGNSGTAAITVPAPVQVATAPAPAHAEATQAEAPQAERVETAAAPEAPLTPPVPIEVQRRPGTRPAAEQSPQPAVKQAVAENSGANAVMPRAPSTPADGLPRAQPEPKRPVQLAFMVVNVAHDDVLNVRSGPSAEFDVVGELQPGSRGVTITGDCQARWCPVEHRSARGWVNSTYLGEERASTPPASAAGAPHNGLPAQAPMAPGPLVLRDAPDAQRACLTPAARALLERIEEKFGPVQVVSTCRPGATIAGTGWPSRHASGNAVDFKAGGRKAEIVEWLIANHRDGGTMTYGDMDHIHVDIGRHYVSLANARHWGMWRGN